MEEINLKIERLGINGEGVARSQGFTVFVDGALPEETVRARLYEKRKSFGRAVVEEMLTVSPQRVKPPCPHFGRCGGCQLMHLSYPEQLNYKRQRVVDALERIGKLLSVTVFPCIPSPLTLGYRNKIQLPGGVGLYARNSHDLVEIDQCLIHCELGEKAFQEIRRIVKGLELRYLMIKTAVNTNQVLVVLVTSSDIDLSGIAAKILASMPEIKGVVQNINSTEGNVALSGEFRTIAGQGEIEEELMGLRFKVSPASFFQVNPLQAQNLYQKTLDLADLKGDETVLDAYCGVGTLSLLLAKKAGKVIGVESVSQTIDDAKENAKRNGISNVEFHCAFAENFSLEKIDTAILNPPRKGCDPLFLEKLALSSPTKILYISCDPATLARDLAILETKGYKTEEAHPFDMFPQTAHVESLALLRLK